MYSCAKREAKAALVVLLQHRLRFSPLTDLHNDDTNPDGCLEINVGQNPPNTLHTCAAPTRRQIKHSTTHPLWRASPLHENPPDKKTWSPLHNTDVYGCPNPEGPTYVMLPPPPSHAMMDRYGTTPTAAGVVLSATEDRAQGANSRMPTMDTMTGKAWHHTVACPSTKIHPTGTWMKPPRIIQINLHNDGQWVTTPPLQWVCGNLRSPLPPMKPNPTRTWTEPQQEIQTCAAPKNLARSSGITTK
ncbi:hypothetical protein BS47DRAFT_1368413 [Hydnum rufescens UP504]|uniref:Uncharacterized protein n=1 Tax=Hydnum rufescens UP504 TaxID=1448309 RepID=A0A9P6AFP7_9AGAM|nr:hypothetical protein BS47DRAFT_1368413 [Hydnum rufescens UP504]